jgi:hypothetical protein
MLPNEDEQSEEIRLLLQQSYGTPEPTDQFVKQLEERLLAILPAASRSARPQNRIIHWLGGSTMRQRIVLGSMAATVLVGLFLVWQGLETKPLSAMEIMAENIRKTKSYKYTQIVTLKDDFPGPGEPSVTESTNIMYWLAPGSCRHDKTRTSPQTWKGSGPEKTNIYPFGKPSIQIDHRAKDYCVSPLLRKDIFVRTFDDLENMGKYAGKAYHELGTKEIDGKKVRGYQIDPQKIEPESPKVQVEIWIDVESNLPVLVRHEWPKDPLGRSSTDLITDIQLNIDLDPKLFDSTPPKGYTDATPKPPTSTEQVKNITDALRIYVEASGGHYPAKGINFITSTEDLCKIFGLAKWPTKSNWPTKKDEKNAALAAKAMAGFSQVTEIKVYNPDFAYYGQTVTPQDNDKVLLRWKLDDGKYEVIFGDLRAETVTAEKLQELEGKLK